MNSVNPYQQPMESIMNPFSSTTVNFDRVQDRRRNFEQAAKARRLVRSRRPEPAASRHPSRPPGQVHVVPVLTLVEVPVSGTQHLPAEPVGEPTTARVA